MIAKLGVILILGIVSLIIGTGIFVLIYPYLIVIGLGLFFLSIAFLMIWVVVYTALFIGAVLLYWSKPMKVKKKGKYSLDTTKEAGRRQKN